jgi:hypothetical protein
MFNSAAIEVVIGLTFIFILYSLLATIISELIANLMKLRGKYLIKGIERMLDDEEIRQYSKDLLNRPEIKYLGNGKRPPSYIKPRTFARALVNTLNKADEPEKFLKEKIKEFEAEKDKSETKEFLYNMMVEANGKLDAFTTLAEDWYNETMDRVAGWYKRRLQLFTFIIGLAIAFTFNVDTIEIAKKLANDSKARMEMVRLATEYAENPSADPNISNELKKEMKDVVENLQEPSTILSMERPKWSDGFWVIVLNILGCILTAVAISIGAPFWFDLLNKLVKLRSSGTQEKTQTMSSQEFKTEKK